MLTPEVVTISAELEAVFRNAFKVECMKRQGHKVKLGLRGDLLTAYRAWLSHRGRINCAKRDEDRTTRAVVSGWALWWYGMTPQERLDHQAKVSAGLRAYFAGDSVTHRKGVNAARKASGFYLGRPIGWKRGMGPYKGYRETHPGT